MNMGLTKATQLKHDLLQTKRYFDQEEMRRNEEQRLYKIPEGFQEKKHLWNINTHMGDALSVSTLRLRPS